MKDNRLNVLIISESTDLLTFLNTQIEERAVFRVTGMNYIPQQISEVCQALNPLFLILDSVSQNGKLLEHHIIEEVKKQIPQMKLVLLIKPGEKKYLDPVKDSIDMIVSDRHTPEVLPYLERVGEQYLMKASF